MTKGLANESTRRFILGAASKDNPEVPDFFWCGYSLGGEEDCCFWHYLFYPNRGPERDGVYHPLYQYEIELLQALSKDRHICVYKSAGIGVTEFFLLWILWKCYKDDFFLGKEAIIITGPNVDLAQDLIRRTKRFLYDKGLEYVDQGAYSLQVNGGIIKCYPSNNIHSARGKPRVSLFFGDEAAFFKLRDDSIVRTVGERYIGKNNAYVIWVSTAGEEPAGFFYEIMLESEAETIYRRFHYYVDKGLIKDPKTNTSIYSEEFIEQAKRARSYGREFLGEWGKNVGDIFGQEALEFCFKNEYDIKESDDSFDRILGVDPGYGSSQFGMVACERSGGGKYTVIEAVSRERSSYIDAVEHANQVCKRLKIRKIFVDASAPELIRDLRDKYHYDVTGISFNQYGHKMIDYAADKVQYGEVRIHPKFVSLKNQLQTIKFNSKGLPDKTRVNPFDLGDAFLLALFYYKMGAGIVVGVY